MNCAETLRQSNFTGEITVISNENRLPYDRTILSKGVGTADSSKLGLRSQDFVEEYGIDFLLDSEVVDINREQKMVSLKNGQNISYDKLLLATGGRAKVPPTPGIDLENVFVLRSADDQDKIKAAA